MFILSTMKQVMPTQEQALPGRQSVMQVSATHYVNGNLIIAPFPDQIEMIMFGLGCFWGAERKFWQTPRVYSTAVGYSGGFTPNATYEEVCTGLTGHNEVVLVMFDREEISIDSLLKVFWQSHNPTQGMRQGNDKGTQYRSGIYTFTDDQLLMAEQSKQVFASKLAQQGYGDITTEIMPASKFYYAEDYHQQYLAKNPNGYCGLGGLDIAYE